jgi:hypothetical protein
MPGAAGQGFYNRFADKSSIHRQTKQAQTLLNTQSNALMHLLNNKQVSNCKHRESPKEGAYSA